MLKGQLSRVPLPGNCWMPFIFQPALWVLQQPNKYSLASYSHWTSTSLHSVCFINCFQFVCFFLESFFKVLHSHIKVPPGHLKGLLATSKWYALLVYSMGKCKQINNSNLPYMSDVISLMICERNHVFRWCHASYLTSVAIPSQHCMKSRYKSRTIIWWFMVNLPWHEENMR